MYVSQAFIGEFISPPTLRILATNYIINTLQEYRIMHINGVDALLRNLPFPLKGEIIPVESSFAL
jgi:hypothetical protein